ncbi:hypothetical protein BJX76DRAFT_331663 [Aspergillus varians]
MLAHLRISHRVARLHPARTRRRPWPHPPSPEAVSQSHESRLGKLTSLRYRAGNSELGTTDNDSRSSTEADHVKDLGICALIFPYSVFLILVSHCLKMKTIIRKTSRWHDTVLWEQFEKLHFS